MKINDKRNRGRLVRLDEAEVGTIVEFRGAPHMLCDLEDSWCLVNLANGQAIADTSISWNTVVTVLNVELVING